MSLSSKMSSPAGHRWHDVAYWGLMLVACGVFCWMNVLTPFKEDDMLHSMIIGELSPVNSLGDLLHSYYNKFLITNGRTSDMVAELFCSLLGKPLFNVCNTLMFGLLAHVVSLLATGRRSLLAQAMLYAGIGTCYPVPGETLLWLAGSCNYLWTITGSLWLLYYLLHHSDSRPGWVKSFLLLLGAILAGAGNEATSFGLLAGMVLYYCFNRQKIDRAVIVGLAGYLLGTLLIMTSPAAWERAASGGIVTNLPFMELVYSRLHIIIEKMARFLVPLAAVAIGLTAIVWKGFKSFKSSVWPYVFTMIAIVLMVLGLNAERPYAGLVTVSLIITIIAADSLLCHYKWLRAAAIVICLALATLTHARGIKTLTAYKAHEAQVLNDIKLSRADQVIMREKPFASYNRFLYPLPLKSDWYFTNEYIWRAYFDKENIQFVSDSVYNRFNEGRLLDGAVPMPFISDRPADAGALVAFPDQDYMLLALKTDTLPTAYQVGTAYWSDTTQSLTEEEVSYRRQHGIKTSSDPFGYYPLRYENQVLMVLPLMGNEVTDIQLLLNYAGSEILMLHREQPNPASIKPIKKPKH